MQQPKDEDCEPRCTEGVPCPTTNLVERLGLTAVFCGTDSTKQAICCSRKTKGMSVLNITLNDTSSCATSPAQGNASQLRPVRAWQFFDCREAESRQLPAREFVDLDCRSIKLEVGSLARAQSVQRAKTKTRRAVTSGGGSRPRQIVMWNMNDTDHRRRKVVVLQKV